MTAPDSVSIIKDNLTIADLVGRYVSLKRKGSRLTACCPFHNEKTPSFHVDSDKGFFHCFGCGKGGDLIKFAQEIEGLDFRETLDFLADIAGVELPKRRWSGPGRDVIENIRALYDDAVAYYQNQLRRNPAARDYLDRRGLRENTVNLFKIGYAPSQWDGLYNHLQGKHPPQIIDQCGLFKRSKTTGSWFDLFRDRVMFPIYDAYGHAIAFGGRLVSGEDGPKYINSPETPIYTKGKHVFNAQFAKAFFKKTREAVIVEGYMDAIQIYQAGVGHVIAGLGTAFTDDQAKLVGRFAKKVILNFDGDSAGFKAARATIETFLKQDMDIRVAALPDNMDPDDFVKSQGVDAYRAQLDNALDFFDFLLQYLADGKNLRDDPRQRSFAVQELCRSLALIQDPVVRNHYLDLLAERLALSRHLIDEVMHRQTGKSTPSPRAGRQTPPAPDRRPKSGLFNKIEQEFLHYAMRDADYARFLEESHRQTLPRLLNRVFHDRPWTVDFLDNRQSDFEERLAPVPESCRGLFREIYMSEAFDAEPNQRLEELFLELYKEMLLKQSAILKQRIRSLPPDEERLIKDLMRKNSLLMKEYHQLIKRRAPTPG